MNSASPAVGLVMGSASDWETMKASAHILSEFAIPFEARVVSAHRMPDEMFAYAEGAAGRGLQAIIAGAGGAAHLPGMLAAKTVVPVLGVPVASRHLQGVDSLHSIVQMPKGVPVATFAIGAAGAANAALFAVAMLANEDAALRQRLEAYRARQTEAARAMTLEMARVHLASGRDVVIPQYLGRPQFLQQAEQVAHDVGARFAEFVLMDGRDNSVRRFTERTAAAATPAHVEAGRMMQHFGGQPALEAMYDRLLLVLSHRPQAQVIESREGAVDETYAALRERLAG